MNTWPIFKNLFGKITSKYQILLASVSQKSTVLKKCKGHFNDTSLKIWIFNSSVELFIPTAGKPYKHFKFTKLPRVELFCCIISLKFKHHWKQKPGTTKINVNWRMKNKGKKVSYQKSNDLNKSLKICKSITHTYIHIYSKMSQIPLKSKMPYY